MRDHVDTEESCQAQAKGGRCPNRPVPGSAYCKAHSNMKRNPEPTQYKLNQARYKHRHGEFSSHEALLSLRDEIALVKILIEERFNMIKNDSDLMVACGPLNTLFLTLEKLVKSCNQLEKSLGNLLSKAALLAFASQVVEIITEELDSIPGYEEIVDRVSDRLITAAADTKNLEEL